MYYLTESAIIQAWKNLVRDGVTNKFLGLIQILKVLDIHVSEKIKPSRQYQFLSKNLSNALEQVFTFQDQKEYQSRDIYWVVFSKNWQQAALSELLVEKNPNILDIAILCFQNRQFFKEFSAKELIESFVEEYHLDETASKFLFYTSDYPIYWRNSNIPRVSLKNKLWDEFKIGSEGITLGLEGNLVIVSHAGELTRAPFFQTLYANQSAQKCLICTKFPFFEAYGFLGSKEVKNVELPALRSHLTTDTHNKIYFGSPGTGKSSAIQSFVKDNDLAHYRTTFHPDYDYGAFVGSYKPVSEGDAIRYCFVPQVFTHAYRHAWERPDETVVLIIEEINRGNCAQIFGDLFQSLDRNAVGYSCYDVDADADLAAFFAQSAEYAIALQYLNAYQEAMGMTVSASKIILPPNLLLYATMNTSDQSLFPMDAAFKRRWDWEYVPIDYDQAKSNRVELPQGQAFNWGEFIAAINPKITNLTRSDDKQIGNWFVRPTGGTDLIPYRQFRSKVMYYLWSEVCKDEQENSESLYFWTNATGESQSFTYNALYGANETDILTGFLRYHEIGMA